MTASPMEPWFFDIEPPCALNDEDQARIDVLNAAGRTIVQRMVEHIAIDEDVRSPCLWVPAEHFDALCQALERKPNVVGAIIYRRKTIRAGEPYSDITTRAP